MTFTPSTDHDWTIHSLNIHGTFFERWCANEIKRHPYWRLRDTQYPVAFSRVTGPLQRAAGHESTLDIRAEMSYGDGRLLTLLIECKKNNPEFVDWIFFSKPHSAGLSQFIAPGISCPTATSTGKPERHKLRPMLKELYFDMPLTDDARETRGDYQNIRQQIKTKTANDSISSGAHQIALATQAIFVEEGSNNLPSSPIKGASRRVVEKQVLFPVIVTTARLRLCNFEPNHVSASERTIAYDKVTLTETPYLIFQYPLPVHLHLDKGHLLLLSSTRYAASIVRMDMFIVNSNHFTEFLQSFHQRFSDLFYDMDAKDDQV